MDFVYLFCCVFGLFDNPRDRENERTGVHMLFLLLHSISPTHTNGTSKSKQTQFSLIHRHHHHSHSHSVKKTRTDVSFRPPFNVPPIREYLQPHHGDSAPV